MKALITLILVHSVFTSFSQEAIQVKMKSAKKPIIQAEINGKKGYFLIDTGSDISIINATELKRYQLEANKMYGDHKRAVGFNGQKAAVMKIKNADVIIGERLKHTSFYSFNITEVVKTIEAKTHIKVMGILGADVLMKYNCIIDYNQRNVVLIDSRSNKRLASK